MNKLMSREVDFIFDPTYTKVSKKVDLVIKELSNIVGMQYRDLFKNRVNETNFVFYNRTTDLEKYLINHEDFFAHESDKKSLDYYQKASSMINTFDSKMDKVKKKLKVEFIKDISGFLSHDDQNYISNHERIDLLKLECYLLFFKDSTNTLIGGMIECFFDDAESKLRNPKTNVLELERILNNRESCLRILGMRNINVNSFDRSIISGILDKVYEYNNLYLAEFNQMNLDKKRIIGDFLITEKLLSHPNNKNIASQFKNLINVNPNYIDSINNEIVNILLNYNESCVLYVNDLYSDAKCKFLIFSPCMEYEQLDFKFIRQICSLAFDVEEFRSVENDDYILGNDKYSKFVDLVIDSLSYQILSNINNRGSKVICYEPNLDVSSFNDGLFLLKDFYSRYYDSIIMSMVENNKNIIYDLVGKSNFENFINIINKYYYDHNGNIIPVKNRSISADTIKGILNISLNNIEQYRKIVVNHYKYNYLNNLEK